MNSQKWLITTGATLALLAGLYVSIQMRGTAIPPETPLRLDHLALPDLEGHKQAFSQWQSKVLLINFWATWCPPCIEEIPIFMQLREKYSAQGFEVVGIAIDEKQKVLDFSLDMAIDYPMVLGDEQGIQLMQRLNNRIGALPYSVLFDRQGKAVHFKSGAYSSRELESLIKKYI